MSSVLGSGGDTNPFEGPTSVGGLSFISLPRQPPQPPPPRLTQQPIPFRGSTKPHCAVKPSKIRDAEFGLHDATDNPATSTRTVIIEAAISTDATTSAATSTSQ